MKELAGFTVIVFVILSALAVIASNEKAKQSDIIDPWFENAQYGSLID